MLPSDNAQCCVAMIEKIIVHRCMQDGPFQCMSEATCISCQLKMRHVCTYALIIMISMANGMQANS